MSENDESTENVLYVVVCSFIFVIVLMQSLALPTYERSPGPITEGDPCKGESIEVDYAYPEGGDSPNECMKQCLAGAPRYILYPDGRATQCALLPGCGDWGESRDIFCVPQE